MGSGTVMRNTAADLLQPGVRRRELFGWAMYDFANSGYTTVVLTAVFAAYFVGGVAQKASWATFAWTVALAISNIVVMLVMPALGAYADLKACKKPILMATTVGCVVFTVALATVGPGDVVLAMTLIVLSNTFYAIGESMTASFLPELARPEAMGRVSGWGWSLGYVGGMLALGLCLVYVLSPGAQQKGADHFVPVTMVITAAIYGLAAIVTFVLLREHAQAQAEAGHAIGLRQAWRRLAETFRQARQHRSFLWLLSSAVFYQGGVAVAIALAAIYAEQEIGFLPQETMVLIFVLNIAAAAGAFAFGHWQDRVGHKRALTVTLLGWILTCVIAALAPDKGTFWIAATIAGLCMGSSQSAGRALAGLLSPPERAGEFFGLWTFAVRLASILGPLGYGALVWLADGNQRLAIAATTVLFLIGLGLLAPVQVQGPSEARR